MKNLSYKKIKDSFDNLNYSQLRKLKEKIKSIEYKKNVANSIDKIRRDICCPHCRSEEYIKWGRQSDLQRFKCKNCNKTFNSLTGTFLARLRRKGHWLDYCLCLIQAKSIRKSAFYCGIDKTTSFRWRHRFLKSSNKLMMDVLNGIVEMDETIQPRSYKGSWSKENKSETEQELDYLLFVRDRYGNTMSFLMNSFNVNDLKLTLNNKFNNDTLICTDKKQIYFEFIKSLKFRHGFVDTTLGIRIKKDVVHINNIVEYQEKLLKWMKRFRGVATKYLENYLSWYRGLDQYDMNPTPNIVLRRSIS